MKATHIQSNGKTKEIEVTRKQLVNIFDLHTRDLRPVILSKQISTISVRSQCIILNLGTIRCIIGHDDAYFFNTESRSTQGIVESIAEGLGQKESEIVSFEFTMLESILKIRFNQLDKRFSQLERLANGLLTSLRNKLSDTKLEELLVLKKQLSTLETKVEETQRPLLSILEDEEELNLLNLTQSDQNKEERQEHEIEIESILENSTELMEDILHKIEDLDENIDDTQEFITLKMANVRNTIIRFDLFISIITATFAVPAVLVGLYGMNIQNNIEANSTAFHFIAGGIVVFIIMAFIFSLWYLKRKKIIE